MAKRALDVLAAGFGLLLLSPLLALIAAAVRLDSSGPALFLQERVGRGGKTFRILKFRTMYDRPDPGTGRTGLGLTVGCDPRVTRVGRLLRKWKLDELPQLLNVLRGEMSLVGPRPEVPKYVASYTPEQRRVLDVRPGITDLASVEFRDENDLLAGRPDPEEYYLSQILPRKLELNRRYVEDHDVWTDIRIILATIARVLSPGPSPALRTDEHLDEVSR
ncbi:MAG: sugar transferase [Trueperaceae bacterium]